MKEQIVTGKKFKILADVTSRLWHVISFWTKAQDVEFNSGQNAQTTLGNITGISDSLTSTSSNVAASSKAIKVLNDKIVNQIGNLNGQISQKDQTINNLNGQIAQKDQTINNLNTQVNSLQSQIDQLNNSVGAVKSFSISGGGPGGGAGVTGIAAFYALISNADGKIKTARISNFNLNACSHHNNDAVVYVSPSPLEFEERNLGPNNDNGVYRVIRAPQNDSGVIDVSNYPNIYIYGRSKYDSNTTGYDSFGATISADVTLN